MRVVNADALSMKLRHMGYMDESEEIQEVIDRFAEERDGELIYRQAAIAAMLQLQDEDIEAYGCRIPEGFDGDRAVMALKELPYAEPQVTVFCNLKDCSLNRNGVCSAECIIVEEDLGRMACLNYDRKENR